MPEPAEPDLLDISNAFSIDDARGKAMRGEALTSDELRLSIEHLRADRRNAKPQQKKAGKKAVVATSLFDLPEVGGE